MIEPLQYDPPMSSLEVVHEDQAIILVNKPSGLLSVPGKDQAHKDCLETRLKQVFADALLVHRLDMDTSGIMVFARTPKAQRHLGLQFERRHVEKSYVARVWGTIESEDGEVDLPLIADWPNRPLQKVDFELGKSALTRWKVLNLEHQATRVALFPRTGRSHQLRVHMKEIGHPILGDRFYAPSDVQKMADRLQLHAYELSFFHPDGGERVQFIAEQPF